MPYRALTQLAWRALAVASLLLGVVGIFLPVLPTVPFVLLAAWAASRGWPALEAWLLAHPRFGPPIVRWREHGAVPRRAKWAATAMMALSGAVVVFSPLPLAARIAVPLTMAAVALWLWTRPDT